MPPRLSKRIPTPLPGVHFNGWHRKVYARGKHVLKVVHSHFTRTIAGKKITLPMWLKSLRRYGVLDMNRAEAEHYEKYFSHGPKEMRENFARVDRVRRVKKGSVLRMEAVRDFDGAMSKTLYETGHVNDLYFWQRFDGLVDYLIKNRIPFFDFSSLNFMVKRVSPYESIPVLVDYKSASTRPYALRIWLRVPSIREKRMRQRYEAMKRKHVQSDDA